MVLSIAGFLSRIREGAHQRPLGRLVVGGDDLVGEIEGRGNDSVHVIVAVLGKASHAVEAENALDALAVELVELDVLGLVDDVVRGFPHTGDVGPGILAQNRRLAGYHLACHVLELGDAREVLGNRVIDGANGLELVLVERLEDHVDGTIRQGAEIEPKELVEGTRIDDLATVGPATDRDGGVAYAKDVTRVDAKEDRDEIVVEHVLEEVGEGDLGHALVRGLREVAVVIAHEDRHTTHDGGIDVIRGLAPLLHRIVQKDVLIHVVGDFGELGIVLLAQLHDGDLLVLPKGRDELLVESLALLLAKGKFERGVVEGHRHKRAMDVGEHLVLVVRPVGEAREVLVHAVVEGVVDVRTVLVDEYARVIDVIVGVAPDVVAPFEDGDLHAA